VLSCRDPCRTAIGIDGPVPHPKHTCATVVANVFGASYARSSYWSMFGIVRPVGTHRRQVLTVLSASRSGVVGFTLARSASFSARSDDGYEARPSRLRCRTSRHHRLIRRALALTPPFALSSNLRLPAQCRCSFSSHIWSSLFPLLCVPSLTNHSA
jgi:hypothetical protein